MDFGKKNYFIKKKELPLKTVYYLSFLFFIVIPILAVLNIALITLNRKFKQQALENVRQAQETISAELKSDIDVMSMRLSHLIYTNNNEILSYAAGTEQRTETADMSMNSGCSRQAIWRWSLSKISCPSAFT